MKKLLGLALVLAFVSVGSTANADVLKNVSTSGEIQVLGTWDNNMWNRTDDWNAKYANTSTRVLFGVHAGLTQDVKANLTLAYYNMWGTDGSTGKAISDENNGGYLQQIDVIEGNVELFNLFCAIDAKIGRQFYGDEDSAVIYFGPNHYNSEQRDTKQAMSIDAANFSYSGEMISWNLIYGKLLEVENDGVVAPGVPADLRYNDADTSLLGFDIKAKITDSFKVQGYIYDIRTKYTPSVDGVIPGEYVNNDHTGFWGVKPSFANDMFKFSAEYARNFDGNRFAYDVNQDMVKVDAALLLDGFTPRAQYYRNNSTNDVGFQDFGNYRPGLIFGQLFEENDLANTTVWNLGLDINLPSMDKLTYTIDLLGFQDVDHLRDWNAFEGDVWVKYAHNDNVELHVAAGTMKFPGDDTWAFKAQSGMIVRF